MHNVSAPFRHTDSLGPGLGQIHCVSARPLVPGEGLYQIHGQSLNTHRGKHRSGGTQAYLSDLLYKRDFPVAQTRDQKGRQAGDCFLGVRDNSNMHAAILSACSSLKTQASSDNLRGTLLSLCLSDIQLGHFAKL